MTDPKRHHRRSIRLRGYDYSQAGTYFITICTHNRECWFGEIADGQMQLNGAGRIVADEWAKTAEIRREVMMDDFVVMPNHCHGIVWITDRRGDRPVAPTAPRKSIPATIHRSLAPIGPRPRSIGALVAGFKSAATARINERRGTPGARVWQRNYHEHVVRNEADLERLRRYILENPARWTEDTENPTRHASEDGARRRPVPVASQQKHGAR